MKKRLCALLLAVLCIGVMRVPALADTGPKAQLIIRVEHAPEEPYYLDLLAEGDWEHADSDDYNGLQWSYSDEERAALDKDLLATLLDAVPQGWHACTAQGFNSLPMYGQLYAEKTDTHGAPLHVFAYHGVPQRYRVLMVTKSGERFLSDAMERAVLQSSVTVDWASKAAAAPPVVIGYGLQFLSTLLPTLAVEGAVLALFGYRARKSWQTFLGVNVLTQGAFSVYIAVTVLRHGVSGWSMLFFLPAELVITAAESLLYRRRLTERPPSRATLYGICANLCSAIVGSCLVEPVWRFIVTIS